MTSRRLSRLQSSDILNRIKERADALWVSASSDVYRIAVQKHRYEPGCGCNWCQKTFKYVQEKLKARREKRYFFHYGCHGDECDYVAYLEHLEYGVETQNRERKAMKDL